MKTKRSPLREAEKIYLLINKDMTIETSNTSPTIKVN